MQTELTNRLVSKFDKVYYLQQNIKIYHTAFIFESCNGQVIQIQEESIWFHARANICIIWKPMKSTHQVSSELSKT